MFCRKCGKELSEDAMFCQYCGQRLISNSGPVGPKTPKNKKAMYVVLAMMILAMAGIIIFFCFSSNNKSIEGIWAYDIKADENTGLSIKQSFIKADEGTLIWFHTDNSIEYYTSNIYGTLDKYSIVDGRLKWVMPLGTTFYYDFELSHDKLILTDERRNVGVFRKFDSEEQAFSFLEENANSIAKSVDAEKSESNTDYAYNESSNNMESSVDTSVDVITDKTNSFIQDGTNNDNLSNWTDDMVISEFNDATSEFKKHIYELEKNDDGNVTYGNVKNIKELDYGFIDNSEDLRLLKYFQGLETLYIDCENINDLSILSKLPKLRHLKTVLANQNVLKTMQNCTTLESLELIKYESDNLESLEKMYNIKSLSITAAKYGSKINYDSISKLPNLETLEIGNFVRTEDLNDIDGCKKIKQLSIMGFDGDNVNFIENLISLQELCININSLSSEQIDFTAINKLNNLEKLSINSLASKAVSGNDVIGENSFDFSNLSALKFIIIRVHNSDISDFATLPNNNKLEYISITWGEDTQNSYDSKRQSLIIDSSEQSNVSIQDFFDVLESYNK